MQTHGQIGGELDAVLEHERVRVGLQCAHKVEQKLLVEYELREHVETVAHVLVIGCLVQLQ